MKKAEFIQEVCNEINTIKEKATTEEISKLNFENFNHTHVNNCIYGMLTGNCNSKRALQLYKKSLYQLEKENLKDVEIKRDKYNERVYNFKQLDLDTKGKYFTCLELYLYMCGSKMHKKIIQYLKGELNELYL